MAWATIINAAVSSYVTLNEAYNESKIIEANAKTQELLANIYADQLGRKATMMENVGVRQAQIELYKGRVAESDATAAMAASGGTVSPEVLAQFKQRAEYNAMSAIFDARMKAIDTRYEAGMTRIGAKLQRSDAKRQAAGIWRDAVTGEAMNALEMWGGTLSQKPNRPANYDWRNVAIQGRKQGRGGYGGGTPGGYKSPRTAVPMPSY